MTYYICVICGANPTTEGFGPTPSIAETNAIQRLGRYIGYYVVLEATRRLVDAIGDLWTGYGYRLSGSDWQLSGGLADLRG